MREFLNTKMWKKRRARKGAHVKRLADRIVKAIKPYCKRIQVAGSIRRGERRPSDIDIVLISKDKDKIKEVLDKKGKYLFGGEQKAVFKIEGVRVELYYTIPREWGAALLAYSSRVGASIGLRVVAKKLCV